MSGQGAGQLVFFAAAFLALAYPLGAWMSRVYGTFSAPLMVLPALALGPLAEGLGH